MTPHERFSEGRSASAASFRIYGVEVTQATQYWDSAAHLTYPNGVGPPDNSIPLVVDKAACVRVYVMRPYAYGETLDVTGTVRLQRLRLGMWVDVGTFSQNRPYSSVSNATTYHWLRNGGALMFLIPSSFIRGRMRLQIDVEAIGTKYRADTELVIETPLRQTLRMRGVPVENQGPHRHLRISNLPSRMRYACSRFLKRRTSVSPCDIP